MDSLVADPLDDVAKSLRCSRGIPQRAHMQVQHSQKSIAGTQVNSRLLALGRTAARRQCLSRQRGEKVMLSLLGEVNWSTLIVSPQSRITSECYDLDLLV